MSDPTTTLTRGAFSLGCRVDVNVHASAERIWAVLTDAKGFPRWNSTVTGIDGQIRDGDSTDFTMAEHFSGLMLPLVKRSFPDFEPVFARYADDLRREAEGGVSSLARS